jgi:RHS repeat-associated protein
MTMPGGTTAVAIDTGRNHTCALLSTMQVSCWGYDLSGQLGNGATTGNVTSPPAAILLPRSFTAGASSTVAGANHSCAVRTDGEVSCWGYNFWGALGNGHGPDLLEPSPPVGLPGGLKATAVAAGGNHTCALLVTGEVSCWGYNQAGQVGVGTAAGEVRTPSAPLVMPNGSAVTAVAAGGSVTCALLTGGQVTCWGSGAALGNGVGGTVPAPPAPIAMPGGAAALGISAGSNHVCALLVGGQVTCWGSDATGQLGNGATTGSVLSPPAPITLPTGTTAAAVSAGTDFTCVLLDTGQVTCWGSDGYGQLGNGATTGVITAPPAPITLPAGTTALQVSAGTTHACALLNTGGVTCWGSATDGRLGNGSYSGTVTAPPAPVELPGQAVASDVSAGGVQTCATVAVDQVSCWGYGYRGAVGDGGQSSKNRPVLAGVAVSVAPDSTVSPVQALVAPEDTIGTGSDAGALVEDPVNTASGNLVDTHVDLSGEGFGLELVRTYNTFDSATSPLGPHWRFGTGGSLEPAGSGVRFHLADGSPFLFTPDGSGGWLSAPGLNATLEVDPASPVGTGPLPMLRVVHRDGWIERFDTDGRLIEQSRWDGQSATLAYDPEGRLLTVGSTIGETLTLGYDGLGRLETAQLSTGRTVSYGYDTAGLLATFTDEFGDATTLTYTPQGWLATVTAPGGVITMSNTYDPQGRVITQTSASGGITTFTYDQYVGATYVHDSVTNTVVRYQHDIEGRVIAITDAYGNAVERGYDTDSNLTESIDRAGAEATATYDTNGNVTSMTRAGVGTTTYLYDASNRVTSMTDQTGATTTYGYELDERIPSTVTNELGQTTSYDVVNGLVMSATDADGVTVTYAYDTARRLTSVANEYNQATTYEYDSRGQRTKVVSPSGRETLWSYHPVTHRLASTTAPDGGVTAYTYDAAGRIETVTDPTGAVTTNTYDTAGRLASTTDPGGATTSFVYDANDRLVTTIEPGGGELSSTYGPLGRLVSTSDQLGRTTSYDYDAEGRQTTSTGPDGGVRRTEYDAAGRPFKTIDPLNRETVTVYDAFGRIESVTAPGGLATSYTYDELGRIETVTDPRGGVTTSAYTPGGRTASVIDAAGLTTSYGYDLAGRQVSVTGPGNLTTSYTYTADGEVRTVMSPGGLVTTFGYDAAGRTASVTDPAGVVTTNTWSLRGELLTSKRGLEGTVSYAYSPDGTLASATDALGHATTFGYDALGNVTSRTAPNGAVVEWAYDAAGQVLSSVDPLDRATSYGYDVAGRVTSVTDPSGRTQTWTYLLDGSINTVGFAGGATTTFGYDSAGRPVTLTDPSGVTTLGYEPGGQLVSMQTPAGRQTTWGYDTAGRRTTITHPDGASYLYGYDTAGRPSTITPGEVMADTFTSANNTAADTGRWTTATAASGTATVQGNQLRLLWANSSNSTASITSRAAAEQDSEQVMRYRFASTTSTTVGRFVMKARNSTSGNLRVELTSNSTTGRIYKQIGSTSTQLGTFSVSVGASARWVRLQVTGTTVKVRTWADGTTEPSTWDATVTNATGVTTVGVPRLEVARTSGTNQVFIDDYRHTNPSGSMTPIVTYGYNTDSQITTETLVGGSRTRTYTQGRLTGFAETLPGLTQSTTRTYDTTGRIRTDTTAGVTSTYNYDSASQLTSAVPSTGTARFWTYDQIGSRATETIGTTTTNYLNDTAGQLCWTTTAAMPTNPTCAAPPPDATTYTHDAAGRMLTETVTLTNRATYTYDLAGRLATTQRVNGATTTTQTRSYDPFGQLAVTSNTGGTTTTTSYDWDPTSHAAGLIGIATAGAGTGLVAGPTGWAAARTASHTAVGLDIYASVVPTTGTTGLARATSYAPHGSPGSGTNTFEPRLGYRGELTLDNQLHLRNRTLLTHLAQFTTVDPVDGMPGTTTINNDYTYANNNPLHLIDPLGLYGITDAALGGPDMASVTPSVGVAAPSPAGPATGTTTSTAAPTTAPTSSPVVDPSVLYGPAPGDRYTIVCGPPDWRTTTSDPNQGPCGWSPTPACSGLCVVERAVAVVIGAGVSTAQGVAGFVDNLARCQLGGAVESVNCGARVLYRAGAVGEGIRDVVNSVVSAAARSAALTQQGDCSSGPRGLIVCVVPAGADVTVTVPPGLGWDGAIPLYQKAGTTIGNILITAQRKSDLDAGFLDHELFHTFQWAAAGGLPFAGLYALEYAKDGECNRFEEAADFVKGRYDDCVGSP